MRTALRNAMLSTVHAGDELGWRLPPCRQQRGEESPDTIGQNAARVERQVQAPRVKPGRRTVSQKIKPPSGRKRVGDNPLHFEGKGEKVG